MPDEEQLTRDYLEDAVVRLLASYAKENQLDTVWGVSVEDIKLLASKMYPGIPWTEIRRAIDNMSDRLVLMVLNSSPSKKKSDDMLYPEQELRAAITQYLKTH